MERSDWKPTKYVENDGCWEPSSDSSALNAASKLMAKRVLAFVEKALREVEYTSVLDLGCGEAPFYGIYGRKASESVLVDWDNGVHSKSCVDVFCDISRRLPFDDQSFDLVLLSDVLEHILDPLSVIKEVCRVLKVGGALVMNTPFLYWLHEEPYDFNRYTEHSLRAFAEKALLTVKKIEPIGGGADVLQDVLVKLMAQSRLRRVVPASNYAFGNLIEKLGIYRAANLATASRMPLAYGCILVREY